MEQINQFFKKYFNKKIILSYLYDSFIGSFLGFLVGMWAVSLVGHFFEFPNFKNLWGLTSKKALVSKETFENLKWIAQMVIGFFVFEIFHKVLFAKIIHYASEYYKKGLNYLEEKEMTDKMRNIKSVVLNNIKEKASLGKEKIKEYYVKYRKPS